MRLQNFERGKDYLTINIVIAYEKQERIILSALPKI
jgi:hypothetical protein